MKIPLIDLVRQYKTIKSEIDVALGRVLESGQFILGPGVEAFEAEIAHYCGAKHAIGVASGTDALLLSLKALEICPGDKVITTPFTFFATAGAIINAGATPIFVDIEPKTYNINPDKIREALERADARTREQIKAVIPVHLYGQMAEMDAILEIAEEYELTVIEDAAQAIGAEYKRSLFPADARNKNKRAGTLGHLGCFSFFPTKNLGAYGDGGMVVTNNSELAEKIRLLRVQGSKPKYHHHLVGTNSRLDALQAAILRVKLKYLDGWSRARAEHAADYNYKLAHLKEIETPGVMPSRTHIYHQYTIRVLKDKRDALRQFLKEHGIETEIYYPLPLHLQPALRFLNHREGDFPEAERAAREVLSLPIFPELTSEEKGYILEAICEFFRGDSDGGSQGTEQAQL